MNNTKDVKKKTNWYVITGGPSSGKTTTVNILKARGYKTTIEYARHYLDTQRLMGRDINHVRNNHQTEFQQSILDMQIAQEKQLLAEDVVFLDRAIPDALAYFIYLHLPQSDKLLNAVRSASYKKIFILDCLPMVEDDVRTENAVAQKEIHDLLTKVYTSLGFPIIKVPVLPSEDRVDFLLNHLD